MYKHFEHFVIRTPQNPLNLFESINKGDTEEFKAFCNTPSFRETIFLASPELYSEMDRWLSGDLNNKAEIKRLQIALFKYFSRSCARCTPFGLFAGFNVGHISKEEKTIIHNSNNINRHRYTRLDMNYLCALTSHLSNKQEIKLQLKYFPNSSLYFIQDKWRYVEYYYNGDQRVHKISSIEYNAYLERVLGMAQAGKDIESLATPLVEPEITIEDAKSFILELIDNQILVSELEPFVSSNDFLQFLITSLESISETEDTVTVLKSVQSKLLYIDTNPPGIEVNYYEEIKEELKKLGVKFNEKFLFQTDSIAPLSDVELNDSFTNRAKDVAKVLSRFSATPRETNISRFANEFHKRYEERAVPLLTVLDPEIGIGYPVGENANSDRSPLLEGVLFGAQMGNNPSVTWTVVERFMLDKYIEAKKSDAYEIEITEKELEALPENKQEIAATSSAMVQIVPKEDGTFSMSMEGIGGQSALCMIGRFCHADEKLMQHALMVANKEKELAKDAVIAEIVHLPEARTGNILMHPEFYDFEIPYLSGSHSEGKIDLADLSVRVMHNKVSLYSQKLGKQVIPRLSNAHNYSSQAQPVYRFLCDMQNPEYRTNGWFSWGSVASSNSFLPRVIFKDVILSRAAWTIKKDTFEPALKEKNPEKLQAWIKQWRIDNKIPAKVVLADGDNELLLDLNSLFNIEVLISTVQKRGQFSLKEFLHDPKDGIVKDQNGKVYSHQIVLAFHKN